MIFRRLVAVAAACGLLAVPPVARPGFAATGDFWVVGGDQTSGQLLAFDPAVADWNSAAAVKWSWKPTAAEGFSSAEISAATLVSDFKLRTWGSGQRFAYAASTNLAAVVDYPGGSRIWAQVIPGNLHSAELLPDGNVAIAASTAGWVRVYASSQGPNATAYAQFDLASAHATVWDPAIMRLWVIGQDPVTQQHILTALRIGGTPARPTLAEDPTWRAILPTAWGHDVYPYAYDSGKLWVTTNSGEYLFDKAAKSFTVPAMGGRTAVKSIGNQPSGQVVETKADAAKSPAGACAATNDWCTDTVDFFGPAATRRRTGAHFYKARVWSPYYGVVDQPLRGPVRDAVRAADGTWTGAATVDANGAIGRTAAAALPDGTLHVQTLVPGSGVWDRTRAADGTWSASTKIDANTTITAIASAALPDGTLHVETLVPGSGIWDRVRSAAGVWASSTHIDVNGDITAVSAAALPNGTLHVQTLVPGGGVWDRTRSAAGTWAASAEIDTNGNVVALSAAGLPDGTLHVQTIVPGGGVWDRARSAAGTWAAAGQIDSGQYASALGATALPDGTLHVFAVDPGVGVWDRVRATTGTWSGPSYVSADRSTLAVAATGLPGGTVHLLTIPEIP
ncbi:DUF6528 family protein [Hamadaea tsunoensis]|uniref:DUF6528 family protein n=1 Tax=Hamadaea tsunoensis TaxID=53368 RepID=UPI0003FED06B|nr:DUF6528 family protein [Hamadaea tsunoensis]